MGESSDCASVRPTRQPKGAIVIVEAEVITGEFAFSLLLLCEREREKKVGSKNKDLGTYSCKLDRHTIACSLSLKGLEGKVVGRNLLRLQVTARIVINLAFARKYTDLTTHYQT